MVEPDSEEAETIGREDESSPESQQDYIDHPLLREGFIERRMYQLELSSAALSESSLVVLPTGTGKTTVSLLTTAARLNRSGDRSKSLFLAPTKPLVEQHAAFYRDALEIPDDKIKVFTGDIRPDDREEEWGDARVVIATPQVVENDLIGNRINLDNVVHLTFDECHRATGDYAYIYIAERYWKDAEAPLVTGMTASPGSDKEEILDVCDNLGISNVEIITEEDSDLSEYTHDTDVEWKNIDVPDDLLEIRDLLNDVVKDRMEKLENLGVINTTRPDISMKELLKARKEIQALMDDGDSAGYSAMSVHAEVMKLRHAVEIIETQGADTLESYFEKLENEARSKGGSKAVKRLMGETKVQKARELAEEYDETHPKMDVMRSLVIDELAKGSRVIVFTEYRDTASTLVDFLEEHDGVSPVRFVGQANKDGDPGLTQKQQKEVLDKFRDGEHNVLVATSVAEEGLDIPEVDLVLFYEPVPSEIRAIQRKGRTGRERAGKVVVLIAKDTRDEAYFWSSKRKEDKMEKEMKELKGVAPEINEELEEEKEQKSLAEFASSGSDAVDEESEKGGDEDRIEIVVDQRETKSAIAKNLDRREDVETVLETLEVGDYVLSDRVAVERKSVDDFISTITGGDRSLFDQVGDLRSNYPRSVLIVEGNVDELYEKGVHPNAIRGTLATVSVDFGAPILFTRDEAETAEMLYTVAKREQEDEDREVSVHGEKSKMTLSEQQEYVVSSIAEVGPVIARNLLQEFGSVEEVMTAEKEELEEVEKIGEKTAERIKEVVSVEYRKSE